MNIKITLFNQVQEFYNDLLTEIETAHETISMMYYAFDHGEWSLKIGKVLSAKTKAGIRTRVMVDAFGQVLDQPRHSIQNQLQMRLLRSSGVKLDIFKPSRPLLSMINRLHCKVCAIDDRTVFLGGSNIGEHYLTWRDTNLRLDGNLGDSFHKIYDHILQFSKGYHVDSRSKLKIDNLISGNTQILLTIPKRRQDIRKALLGLILDAKKDIYIRTWYFLPDQEITKAILAKVKEGVDVNILLSHKTRVRPIDYANNFLCHNLAKSGVRIIRYTKKYMHAKVAWNDQGDVLFGSANLENMALKNTFECCVFIQNHKLCQELHQAFIEDTTGSLIQSPSVFRQTSFANKTLSYVCNLASPFL